MATTVQYGLKSVQKVIKFPSRTENQKLILKSRSEFSSYLLGDQTPTAMSRALWYQITAVGGVRIGMAKTRGNADTSNLK